MSGEIEMWHADSMEPRVITPRPHNTGLNGQSSCTVELSPDHKRIMLNVRVRGESQQVLVFNTEYTRKSDCLELDAQGQDDGQQRVFTQAACQSGTNILDLRSAARGHDHIRKPVAVRNQELLAFFQEFISTHEWTPEVDDLTPMQRRLMNVYEAIGRGDDDEVVLQLIKELMKGRYYITSNFGSTVDLLTNIIANHDELSRISVQEFWDTRIH